MFYLNLNLEKKSKIPPVTTKIERLILLIRVVKSNQLKYVKSLLTNNSHQNKEQYLNAVIANGLKENNYHTGKSNLFTLCMLGNFSGFCCRLLTFFKIIFFKRTSFRNTIRVTNSLDPDQDQCSVDPNLGPKLFVMTKVAASRQNMIGTDILGHHYDYFFYSEPDLWEWEHFNPLPGSLSC